MRALQQQAWSKQYRRKEEEHRTEGTEKNKRKSNKNKTKAEKNANHEQIEEEKGHEKRRRAKHRNCPKQRLLPRSPGHVSSSPSSLSSRSPISLSFSLFYFCFRFVSFTLCFL